MLPLSGSLASQPPPQAPGGCGGRCHGGAKGPIEAQLLPLVATLGGTVVQPQTPDLPCLPTLILTPCVPTPVAGREANFGK